MSVNKFRNSLFESILDLLWKQWTALGIPGQVALHDSENILDPEALLVFSAGYARYDQRLYDLILDWLKIHSSQLNLQRLKAINAKAEWKDSASLGYICAVIAETEPARWKKAVVNFAPTQGKDAVPLFRDRNNVPEKYIPRHDHLALRCGFVRNIHQDSAKITGLLPPKPATLLLQMRGLLGISARAETILILLTSHICKVQDIVERSNFTWKSIQDVLAELAQGGFVSSLDSGGHGKLYYLTDREKMLSFLNLHAPVFWNWLKLYEAIGLLWDACSNPYWEKVSDETIQNELHDLYRKKLQKKLLASGCPSMAKTSLDIREFPKLLQKIS